jgi:hypothetical protein
LTSLHAIDFCLEAMEETSAVCKACEGVTLKDNVHVYDRRQRKSRNGKLLNDTRSDRFPRRNRHHLSTDRQNQDRHRGD